MKQDKENGNAIQSKQAKDCAYTISDALLACAALVAAEEKNPINFSFKRDGVEFTAEIKVGEKDGHPVIGLLATMG